MLLGEMTDNLDQTFFKAATDFSRFYFISRAADRMWGRPCARLMERPGDWLDWVHPEDRAGVAALLGSNQDQGDYAAEFRIVWPDGEVRWIHSHAFVLGQPGGDTYVIGYQSDITARKNIEVELTQAKLEAEKASVAKTRFLAAASHDLRQPIQAIKLFSDALGRTKLSADQRTISSYLARSVQSLSHLLNVLLDVSKLDAGALSLYPEVIAVDDLFARIDAEFSPIAPDRPLRFMYFFPIGPMAVRTDIALLMSLLGNLIGNAVKYTNKGGILVSLRRRGDRALVQVWDTGIGILPKHMDSIFEDYFQVANAARDRTKGLGLGLAIARRVARLLGTEVVCRSRPGKGSVFSFCLPLSESLPEAHVRAERRATRRSAPAFAGRRIVVVEDDLDVAEAIKLSLESLGMRVTLFGTAESALSDAKIADADFYVSDFRLPGMNGLQFLDALSQRSATCIRAVILTGDTSPERIALTETSFWTVLFKPVDLAKLLSAIGPPDSPD